MEGKRFRRAEGEKGGRRGGQREKGTEVGRIREGGETNVVVGVSISIGSLEILLHDRQRKETSVGKEIERR